MILLKEINLEMLKFLKRISRASKFPQVRNRAQCIILRYQGFSTEKLMTIFGISRRTLYNWLTRWEKSGFIGLYNEKGRGRKAKLSSSQIAQVKDWVKAEPKRLNKVVIKIRKEWGIEVSKETIKRTIKKLNMMQKRMKRGLSKTPDEWELEVKTPELLKLKEQDWLPTYSPKHNLIKILQKFIKYEWIEVDADESWSSLIQYLKKVLDNLGTEYAINFVQLLRTTFC